MSSALRLSGLIKSFCAHRSVSSCLEDARAGVPALDFTCVRPARSVLATALNEHTDRTILYVTSTFREAEQQAGELSSLLGEDNVCYYPAWETLPHERLSPRSDTVGKRLAVLRRLCGNDEMPVPKVVVAPVRAMLQPQVSGLGAISPVKFEVGQEYPLDQLAQDLVNASYARVDLVERRGEFAIRGGIADVFPPTLEHPVRVDFFGDEIDSITFFSVADQRSSDETIDEVVASPCRELLITDDVRNRAADLIETQPELSDMLGKIAEGQVAEGMESLLPALVDKLELLVDVVPKDTLVLVADPELVRTRAEDLVRTSQEFLHAGWAAAADGGKAPIDLSASAYQELADVRAHALSRGLGWWTLSPFAADAEETETEKHLEIEELPNWRGEVDKAIESIADEVRSGVTTLFSVEGKGLGSRISELLSGHEVGSKLVEELPETPEKNIVTIFCSQLHRGFRLPDANLVVHASGDMTETRSVDKSRRKMPSRRKNQVVVEDLKAGELLVHEQHGVGRFVELAARTIGGATREYLVLEYAPSKRGQPGDRLFVPMDQLDQITKYVGGESPQLDKMGGADWKKRKAKAKKAVKQIAAGLIKLYAARQATRGHAFAPDTPWQHELEDAFSYVETPDQLSAIEEVKRDMEREVPMDRLISGDVGYGKTEIAVRAAFKAVQDNKQVLVLVPTTLLVQQHYSTFANRYAGFPVTVEAMSRFQSEKEIQATLDGLAAGTVDVVIGTHRLLSDKVKVKDLGLVIIDEEQRFGVEHKEKLKKLRVNVDVLAMSATPIPRTLEMAITGIREMSTIATPPEERHPVLTFVGPYDRAQVGAAIRRELAREGQVFYVHNRVQDIEKVASEVSKAIPEARILVAHGQMSERQLEQVMVDFWERRADVLVATTIVEAGIDISTANTLIVDRADQMGLSQLHQLRGRVGRGRERGYAYLMYPPSKPLTTTAHERLNALATNTDLGAGMAIAIKDLEIRGAGNLLGAQQSGHIADVGFDLYLRLVGDAVANFKSEGAEEEAAPVRIEMPIDAHLPENYVESERLRLEMYRRIAAVRNDAEVDALADEMADRYGSLPDVTKRLLQTAKFRLLCQSAGLHEVVMQGRFVRVAPVFDRVCDGKKMGLPDSRKMRLDRLYPGTVIKEATNLMLVPKPDENDDILAWASDFVKGILLPKNHGKKAD